MYMHFNYTKILCLLVPLIVSPPLARAANLVVESGVMTVIGQMPISGRVLDADGNPIVGATITNLRNQKLTQTDADGNFSIDGVIGDQLDRKSTRLNSSHVRISYAVFCLKKKIK